MQDRSWQGILVGYDGTTNYRIYDPTTGVVYITRSVTIDEKSFYDKSQNTYPADFVDEEWQESDDDEFADPDEGDESQVQEPPQPVPAPKGLSQLLTPEQTPVPDHQSDQGNAAPVGAIGSDEEDNGEGPSDQGTPFSRFNRQLQGLIREGTEALNEQYILADDDDDEDVVLPPEVNIGRGKRNRIARNVKGTIDNKWKEDYYDSNKAIPKVVVPPKAPKNPKPPASANIMTYGSSIVPESYRHMVRVLTMLSNDIDNAGSDEPRTLREARQRTDWQHWLNAMTVEMDSLTENQVWELVNAPPGSKILTGRWVFKLKKDRFGNVLKYKARWVAYGYKQQYGVDYEETFAAVAKPMSWKALLALAVLRKDVEINQMDVVTAFLYGFLDEVIYMEQPHL